MYWLIALIVFVVIIFLIKKGLIPVLKKPLERIKQYGWFGEDSETIGESVAVIAVIVLVPIAWPVGIPVLILIHIIRGLAK